ncbi:hypothetical protein DFJ74DRAFT_664336 [Hyaloraphidium curvatum]|nr:hypothetical protein DFJ74DRAFT_664336 [Hyaloraphidium curvatum]
MGLQNALWQAVLIYSCYVLVGVAAVYAARNVHGRAARGIATGVLILAALHCPLVPQWRSPSSPKLFDESKNLYWMLVCCTFVVSLRIFYFVYLRPPSFSSALPFSFLLASMMFNTDIEHGVQGIRRWREPKMWSRIGTTLLALPAKLALLAWLGQVQAPPERRARLYKTVYTWNMLSLQYLLDGFWTGLMFYPYLSLPFDTYLVLGSLFTGLPMEPMFASPALTTSPRDFWSGRWNLLVKNTFHRSIFVPATHVGHPQNGDTKAIVSFAEKVVSSLGVFFVSAISHDWINYLTFGRYTPDNFIFFMLNGLLTNIESYITHFRPHLFKRLGELPRWVKVVSMWTLMGATVPVFMREYLRTEMVDEAASYARWAVESLGIRVA